jgi:hypothetical protein
MIIPDHFSESLEQLFCVLKMLKFFDADPDTGSCQPWIRDGKKSDPGWKKTIPDPQDCCEYDAPCSGGGPAAVPPRDGLHHAGREAGREEQPAHGGRAQHVHHARIQEGQSSLFFSVPDPDPLVRGIDADPDPSIIMQKYFVTLFDFLSLKN